MAGFLNLTLDTHAPVVTWGPVVGTDVGEELVQDYTVNEPGVYQAELRLADGRVLPMVVEATRLRVQLPEDTPEGQAQVRAYVRDDVLNAAIRTRAVALTGIAGEPPPAPAPYAGPPSRDPPAPSLVRWDEAPVHLGSRDRVLARSSAVSRLRTRSRYTVPGTRAISRRSRLYLSSTTHVAARVEAHSAAQTSSSDRLWKRPEGPRFEEELIDLDIL